MEWLIVFIPIWIGCCVGTGALAKSRGHEPVSFALLALVISPLLACIVLLVMPSNVGELERMSVVAGSSRKCPFCAETVKSEAIVCRFCGRDIPPVSKTSRREIPVFTRQQVYQNTLDLIRELERKRLVWVPSLLPMLRELHEISLAPSVDQQQCDDLVARIDGHLHKHQLLGLRKVSDWAHSAGRFEDIPDAQDAA